MDGYVLTLKHTVEKFSAFVDMLEQGQYEELFLESKTAGGILLRHAADLSDAAETMHKLQKSYHEKRKILTAKITQLEEETLQRHHERNDESKAKIKELEEAAATDGTAFTSLVQLQQRNAKEKTSFQTQLIEMQYRYTINEQSFRIEVVDAKLSLETQRQMNAVLEHKHQEKVSSSASALLAEKELVKTLEQIIADLKEEMDAVTDARKSQPVSRLDFNTDLEQLAKSLMKHTDVQIGRIIAHFSGDS